MYLSKVYVRFYRSFNFDYLRKSHENARPNPWDVTEDELFYPFVAIPMEEGITTIVGANESGKSQLLSAIEYGISGKNIDRGDFCRYSPFFAVDRSMSFPDFGLEFKDLSESHLAAIRASCSLPEDRVPDPFTVFRFNNGPLAAFSRVGGDWERLSVDDPSSLQDILPKYFTIDANVALPDSVPLEYLVSSRLTEKILPRPDRLRLFEELLEDDRLSGSSTERQAALVETSEHLAGARITKRTLDKQMHLADELLTKVAGIDRSAFSQLRKAVKRSAEGYANGIVAKINQHLASAIDFPKWWSQDQHFALLVTLRDFDLVFTIRDRTGTEYTLAERSGGLKYFLSYLVQYLAHDSPEETHEILLMDEPDAYLSSIGQQDLLRIFEKFAYPDDGRRPCQVVYVTHSPFLIDKNHGERIRVLEKGVDDEGARIVKNVSRNHYEPLRTSFGSFVGETTFIGNSNLMVEGMSDQILLAGMSSKLRNQGASSLDTLDLNAITLVPAGSASHIPYLVYLARGREVDRPPVMVLLDSDQEGNKAKQALCKGGPRDKKIIDPEVILQLGDLSESLYCDMAGGVQQTEDLIPLEIAWRSVKQYVHDYVSPSQAQRLDQINPRTDGKLPGHGLHAVLQALVASHIDEEFHLDKIGFARSVMDVILRSDDISAEDMDRLDANFRSLFRVLGERQRRSNRREAIEKNAVKIRRVVKRFFQDHPQSSSRAEALLLIEEIDSRVTASPYSDDLKVELNRLRREFELGVDESREVSNFETMKAAFEGLPHFEQKRSQESQGDFNAPLSP